MADSASTETLHDLDDADEYLDRLLDRLFVQRVAEIEERLIERFDGLEQEVKKGLRRTADEVARSGREISKSLTTNSGVDRKEFGQLREMLRAIRDQDAETVRRAGRILEQVEGSEDADRARYEATQKAVSTVLQTVETLGNAEVGRDEVASEVANDLHEELAVVRSALEEEVRGVLGSIERTVSGLVEEERQRAENAEAELAGLRRWVLAAVVTAGLALAAVIATAVLGV